MGGCEKPLLSIGHSTLVEVAVAAIAPHVAALALNVRLTSMPLYDEFRRRGLFLYADPVCEETGPLGGIIGGLEWLQTLPSEYDWLATVPCDCPFLSGDLVPTLSVCHAPEIRRPIVAVGDGHIQSLCALWPRQLLNRLKLEVAKGATRSVRSVLAAMNAIVCPVNCDFFNVNTPADLAIAEKRFREHRTSVQVE